MVQLKTRPNDRPVSEFLESIENPRRRQDAQTVTVMMAEITGDEPQMWGDSIIGFGTRHLRYAGGRELNWFVVGLSPRRQALTVYVLDGFEGYADLLELLGPHSTGKSCLYIRDLDKVDIGVLRDLIERTVTFAGD